MALPLAAKGTATLKRTTEALTRLSLQLAGGNEVIIQADPEPSARQILHAFQACRSKLGLRTTTREAPKGSHASNGVAEKAVSTVRAHARTLKADLESRLQIEISGHLPVYAWMLRHSSFIHNRFFVTSKGLPPYEVVNGTKYKGKLLVFGEQCIFYAGSRYKGDLQWRKGVWVGINERNQAHVLLTPDGAVESRSIRRLPSENQWCAEAVVGARGLPWSYGGSAKRKRPIYTSQRIPLLPDTASLEEIAKAAGRAAAETIAAGTPVAPQAAGGDEAGSDNDKLIFKQL